MICLRLSPSPLFHVPILLSQIVSTEGGRLISMFENWRCSPATTIIELYRGGLSTRVSYNGRHTTFTTTSVAPSFSSIFSITSYFRPKENIQCIECNPKVFYSEYSMDLKGAQALEFWFRVSYTIRACLGGQLTNGKKKFIL